MDLFMNLMHFMNDDDSFVRGLVLMGAGEILVEIFAMDKEDMGEDSIRWVVNTFIIMH